MSFKLRVQDKPRIKYAAPLHAATADVFVSKAPDTQIDNGLFITINVTFPRGKEPAIATQLLHIPVDQLGELEAAIKTLRAAQEK